MMEKLSIELTKIGTEKILRSIVRKKKYFTLESV